MEKTGKPTVAGILNIIAGVLGILWMTIAGLDITSILFLGILAVFLLIVFIFTFLVSVLALVGGIFGVQRRRWGWALVGSIAAVVTFLPLGVASTILTARSKDEFE